jgi:hypothetical protein
MVMMTGVVVIVIMAFVVMAIMIVAGMVFGGGDLSVGGRNFAVRSGFESFG